MRQAMLKRLAEEFALRGTPLNTQLTYRGCIERFERHHARSSARLGRAHVRDFLVHLVEHEKLSQSTHNVYAAALYFLYPPSSLTEEATLREANLCAREGITINIFLLNSWNQTPEDVRFAYRVAESTRGRVFFTAGRELDRYVVWDYIKRRKQIIS